MELIFTLLIWVFILGVALMFAQFVLGIIMWVIIGAVYLVTAPFVWAYRKIKGE